MIIIEIWSSKLLQMNWRLMDMIQRIRKFIIEMAFSFVIIDITNAKRYNMLLCCCNMAKSRRLTRTPTRTLLLHRRMERSGKWHLAIADKQTRIATRRTRLTPMISRRLSRMMSYSKTLLLHPINIIKRMSRKLRLAFRLYWMIYIRCIIRYGKGNIDE